MQSALRCQRRKPFPEYDMTAFENVSNVYEKFGADEPFYAVLSESQYKRNRLDVGAFFAHGRRQIDELIAEIDAQGLRLGRHRALDFGCGVGRLSCALALHFDKVTGVDVSSSMIATARDHCRRSNCEFLVNKKENLGDFPNGYFDFVLSDITIQHIPAPASENYVRDFLRVLKPNGLAIFLIPDGPDYQPNSLGERWERFYRERVRPFTKRVRGKHAVQVHYLARQRVESLVTNAGGFVYATEVHPDWTSCPRPYKPLYYWAKRKAI
jgi:ubiquinone/menaquinone biosynthesis C-methylase UbiE